MRRCLGSFYLYRLPIIGSTPMPEWSIPVKEAPHQLPRVYEGNEKR